ncbi:MAG: carbon monoxide dehydrogenase, partial [Desulfobacterales bacterium]|nr:carbon monoxide dehydrogenase [Desulfobacterales bacterium]
METIHLKTVDPVSQELLRAAGQKGIQLSWERYERLQPPDGFLRLGLSCPYGCMHGPCRIDPFGRGPDRGLCGIDRDAMVAAFLLRLTLQGV